MKISTNIFLSFLCCIPVSLQGLAQEPIEPYIIPGVYALKIDDNGKYIVAQDLSYNAMMIDLENDSEFWYGAYYPGNGNCISTTGMMVGQSMVTAQGAVMINGEGFVPDSFAKYESGSINAITSDGTRVCGYVQNPNIGPVALPVYCDINGNEVGEAVFLPYPDKDFFGDTPQYCIAIYISDDGKTIAGIVQDSTGFFSYPIVYKQDSSGDWSYTCPTRPLFNPENLPIPKFPDLDNIDLPKQPVITDFMSPEMKAEWEADMADYEATGDPELNPWNYVTYFTGEEGYQEFENAIGAYNRLINEMLGESIDNYWKEMEEIGKNTYFIPNMALSPDGGLLIADNGVTGSEFATDEFIGFESYIFNLTDGTFSPMKSDYENLIPTQILPDGTVVTVSSPSNSLPYNCYLKLPDSEKFISFEEYLQAENPGYASWVAQNLNLLGNGSISGLISFSKNKSVIVGGLPISEQMSYVISLENASIQKLESIESETYVVYNLSGIKVLSTEDKSQIYQLPEGIYIINGKKIKI